MLTKIFNKYRNLILYGFLGSIGALTDLVVYLLLVNLLHIHPSLASFLSVSSGIVVSFILNSRYNFKKTDHIWLRFVTFFAVGLFGAILSASLLYVLFDLMRLDPVVAKFITIPPVVLAQFFVNKRVSFSDNPRHLWKLVLRFLKEEWLMILVVVSCGVLFIVSSDVKISVDEMDNVLSGKLISQGEVPYRDFFSHHSPGMYYISSAIHPIIAQDITGYRPVFNAICFVILVTGYYVIRKHLSNNTALIITFTMACAHTVGLMNVGLAESLIALIVPILIVMIFFPIQKDPPSLITKVTISLLLFSIPFLSLGYLLTVLPLYTLFLYQVIRTERKNNRLRSVLGLLAIYSLPYILYLSYLLVSKSLSEAYFDVILFNLTVYAPSVSETGGGLVSSISGAIAQISTVLTNSFRPEYFLQCVLLSGFIVFIGIALKQKKYATAITSTFILLLSSTRSNIFNPPPISSGLDDIAQHGAMYISLAVAFGAISYTNIVESKKYPSAVRVLAMSYLIIVPFAFAFFTIKNSQSCLTDSSPSLCYSRFVRSVEVSDTVKIINAVTNDGESFWVAPQDFASQLFIVSTNASRYKFYFPWLDDSELIRNQVASDIRKNRPTVIYFDKTYYASINNTGLLRILESNYFSLPDRRLQNYYFEIASRKNIIKELESHGYKTE